MQYVTYMVFWANTSRPLEWTTLQKICFEIVALLGGEAKYFSDHSRTFLYINFLKKDWGEIIEKNTFLSKKKKKSAESEVAPNGKKCTQQQLLLSNNQGALLLSIILV